jgi:metal-dependent amidase/aminoacylase/carboxypeptidase family protein
MGAEDFSYMLNERPGAYIFVGNGDTAMVHHPAYNFDDDVIPFGSSWYAGMVETRMPEFSGYAIGADFAPIASNGIQ